MPQLLQINSSLFGVDGQSTRLAKRFAEAWKQRHEGGKVIVRDLVADPLPHLDGERFQAFITDPQDRSADQKQIVGESDALIDELRGADEIAIGLPMYNLGVPSQLKAWFDHIARAGETFRYTSNGPEGLLADRPVHLFAARGGQYAGGPADSQTRHVSDFLGLLGLTRLNFVYAEGMAMDETQQAKALAAAEEKLLELVAA